MPIYDDEVVSLTAERLILAKGAMKEREWIREELLEDLLHQHQGKMPLWVFDDLAASIKRICPES